MSFYKYIILFLIILATPIIYAKNCEHGTNTFRCVKFIKNYDADTITFNINNVHPLIGHNITVRVRHIDAPEMKSKSSCEINWARTSQKLVERLLKNASEINLLNVSKDKYFRLLADIEFDGKSLSQILLKNNLAYVYEGKTKAQINWCNRKPAYN